MAENNRDYIRKHVDTIILNVLSESDNYGYEILKLINDKSDGLYNIKQPTLYNSLKRLEKIGYISSYQGQISNGGQRKYYKLTDYGKDTLETETKEWEFSRTLMSKLISDKDYDLNSPPPYNPNDLRPMTKRNIPHSEKRAEQKINKDNINSHRSDVIDNKNINNNYDKSYIRTNIDTVNKSSANKSLYSDYANKSTLTYISPTSTRQTTYTQNTEKDEYKATKGYQLLYGDLKDDKPKDKDKENLPTQLSINDALQSKNDTIKHEVSNDIQIKANIDPEKQKDVFSTPDIQLNQSYQRKSQRIVDPVASKPLREDEVMTNRVQYRPALDELFETNKKKSNSFTEKSVAQGHSYNNLKTKLKTEGHNLRVYSKANTTTYYLSNFIYSNQINRDCFTLMYLLIALEIFSFYFLSDSLINLGFNTYLTIASSLIIVPIAFWLIYAYNPNKRIKAKFNFKVSLLTSLMVFFNLLVVIMLLGFFLFNADITDINTLILPIIMPTILIVNIPLSSVIYAILYKTKQYHLR